MNKTYKKTNRGGKISIFENLPKMEPNGDQICVFSQNSSFLAHDYYLSSDTDLDLEPRDYLLLLPAPYGEMAYKNFDQKYFGKRWNGKEFTKEKVLIKAFNWSLTPQGGDFWDEVYYGKFPEIKKQTENKEMTEEKQNIQTKITPAFAEFIKSHPKAKIGSPHDNESKMAVLYSGTQVGGTNINFLSSDFGYKQVSNGEFIDALDALPEIKKEKTLSFEVLGHYPIVGENVKIGCQTFELESCKKFAAEYEEWKSGPADWNTVSRFSTESSISLRKFIYSLRPELCCFPHWEVETNCYPFLVFSLTSEPIGGDHYAKGEKLTTGQFIDKVINLKKERKFKKIRLGGIEVCLSEEGGMTVYGLIPHEMIEKLIKETA